MTVFEMVAAVVIALSLAVMIIEDTQDDSSRMVLLPLEM